MCLSMESSFWAEIQKTKHEVEAYEFTCQEKFITQLLMGKNMLTIFWDAEGFWGELFVIF